MAGQMYQYCHLLHVLYSILPLLFGYYDQKPPTKLVLAVNTKENSKMVYLMPKSHHFCEGMGVSNFPQWTNGTTHTHTHTQSQFRNLEKNIDPASVINYFNFSLIRLMIERIPCETPSDRIKSQAHAMDRKMARFTVNVLNSFFFTHPEFL